MNKKQIEALAYKLYFEDKHEVTDPWTGETLPKKYSLFEIIEGFVMTSRGLMPFSAYVFRTRTDCIIEHPNATYATAEGFQNICKSKTAILKIPTSSGPKTLTASMAINDYGAQILRLKFVGLKNVSCRLEKALQTILSLHVEKKLGLQLHRETGAGGIQFDSASRAHKDDLNLVGVTLFVRTSNVTKNNTVHFKNKKVQIMCEEGEKGY